MITLDLSILNQKGTPMFNSDIFANRPNFGIAGRIFISTDTLQIYRDTGSAWDLLSGGGGGGTISGFVNTGQVAFGTATNTIGSEASFSWDSANNRLGVGTNAPQTNIQIADNKNGITSLQISNTTAGTSSQAGIRLDSDASSGTMNIGKYSSTSTSYLSISALDGYLSNANFGDIVLQNEVATGKIKFAAGGSSTAQATLFSNGNFAIGSTTDTGQKFQVTGTSNFVGNITLPLNQNAATGLTISNNTSGTAANSFLKLQTTNASSYGEFAKLSSIYTTYKIFVGNDLAIYNTNTSGDISILNDFATGIIKFAAGGSSTAQMILTAAGRLGIGTITPQTNIQISDNKNGITSLQISNTTAGTSSQAGIRLDSDASSGTMNIGKYSSTSTSYLSISALDGYLSNANFGDIVLQNEVATGKIKFAAGASSTAHATLFSNGNFAVGSNTDTGQKFQVVGSSLLNGNVTFSSATGMFWDSTNSRLGIGTNTPTNDLSIIKTSAANGDVGIYVRNLTASGSVTNAIYNDVNEGGAFQIFGSTFAGTSFRNTVSVVCTTANGFAFLASSNNANAHIKFVTTTSLTERMRIVNSTGNVLIQNGGTFTDSGERLQVTGTAKITDTQSYTTGTIQSLAIVKNLTINSAISASSGICNYVSTGDNGISSSQSVPASTSFANIYAFNKYQFNSAGLTLTATQASPGVRTISQLFTQNVFKGTNSGTITHMSGIQIGGYYNDNTGTITPVIPNAYQLLINDTGAYSHTFTFTNRWGIYQEGINDRNYLAGNLMLNSTTDTGQILQVTGAIRVNGQSSGTAGVSSGNYLIINVDGTSYKIALLNP